MIIGYCGPYGVLWLICKDGSILSIHPHYATISPVLDLLVRGGVTSRDLPCDVEPARLMVDFMEKNKFGMVTIPKPLSSTDIVDVLPDDLKWLGQRMQNLSRKDLFDTVLVANQLGISTILEIACAQLAALIKGKPVDQIERVLANLP
jgi:hypothetical protein